MINLIAQMTGLKIQFTNGYSWPELVQLYQNGEIDLLQSVILTENNRNLGLPGNSYVQLPFAVATAENSSPITDLSQLNTKQLAIPAGWSIIPIIRARYPLIEIVETESTLQALEMVLAGKATAALDNEVIMRYIARNYFLAGLQFHSKVNFGEGALPDKLHIVVPADKPQLRKLIDKAIAAIGEEQLQYPVRKVACPWQ